VVGERVGIMGGSRGGEAALLAAAMFDGIAAVVSTVGSAVVTQGIPRAASLPDILRTPAASWTYRGTPLPYLPYTVTDQLEESVRTGAPVELRTAFVPALGDREIVKRATIPVERIQGGVLLIMAGDDRMWPSGPLSDIALPRLQRARHPYPCRHLHHDAAGHAIAPPPFGPTTARTSPGPGVTFAHGGTPDADAHARADAWQRSIAFLAELLAGQRPGHR
jgi:dienelactone hydrolase